MAYADKKSILRRREWMAQGLLQASKKSFWAGYTGKSQSSLFHQVKLGDSQSGFTLIFDARGNLTDEAIADRAQAWGKGEKKRVFSSSITLRRWRQVVDNGDKFDAIDIGHINLAEHGDSRALLADKVIRHKDQAWFDTLQGNLARPESTDGPGTVRYSGAPTHLYQFQNKRNSTNGLDNDGAYAFGYDEMTDLCTSLETGGKTWRFKKSGEDTYDSSDKFDEVKQPVYFDSEINRPPLEPYRNDGGMAMWMFVCDASVMNLLRKGDIFKTFAPQADVRGNDNMVFKGIIGSFQNLMIVQAPTYFGSESGNMWNKSYAEGIKGYDNKPDTEDSTVSFKQRNGTWQLSDSRIQNCGMRQYKIRGNKVLWQGMPEYDTVNTSDEIWSRALILGGNAGQIAWGKMPDYKYQASFDFGITSQSAVEYWFNLQKTKWNPELGGDYDDRKVTNIDWGCIPVDIRIA